MLACYPTRQDANILTQIRLAAAYMRRKQFEARLIAVEVSKLFAPNPDQDRVSEDEMIGLLGITPIIATYAETS